jgi:hypothetical protein
MGICSKHWPDRLLEKKGKKNKRPVFKNHSHSEWIFTLTDNLPLEQMGKPVNDPDLICAWDIFVEDILTLSELTKYQLFMQRSEDHVTLIHVVQDVLVDALITVTPLMNVKVTKLGKIII